VWVLQENVCLGDITIAISICKILVDDLLIELFHGIVQRQRPNRLASAISWTFLAVATGAIQINDLVR
jgi:hypothetical protein